MAGHHFRMRAAHGSLAARILLAVVMFAHWHSAQSFAAFGALQTSPWMSQKRGHLNGRSCRYTINDNLLCQRAQDPVETLQSFESNIRRLRSQKEISRAGPATYALVGFLSSPRRAACTGEYVYALERASTQALRAAGEAGDYRLVMSIVDAAIKHSNLDPILSPRIFGEAIAALAMTSASASKVKRIWKLMCSSRKPAYMESPPTAYELNVVIRTLAAKGKVRTCLSLLNQHSSNTVLPEMSSVQIACDSYTLATIFNVLRESIDCDQAPVGNDRSMIPMNMTSTSSFSLSGLSFSPCWQWIEAIRFIETLGESCPWNNHAVCALLKLQERATEVFPSHQVNHATALKIWDLMMSRNLYPDVITCTLILRALGDGRGSRNSGLVATRILDAMTNHPRLSNPNAFAYSAAISASARSGDLPTAFSLLSLMRGKALSNRNDPQPNTWVYNAALSAMIGKHQRLTARSANLRQGFVIRNIISQMILDHERFGWDCRPDTITYNTALSLLCINAEEGETLYTHELFKEMKASSVPRDVTTYISLVKSCRADAVAIYNVTEEALWDLRDTGHLEDDNLMRIADTALALVSKQGNIETFNALLSLASAFGLQGTANTVSHIIDLVATAMGTDIVPVLLVALSDISHSPDARTSFRERYNFDLEALNLPGLEGNHFAIALEACLRRGGVDAAQGTITIMRDLRVKMSSRNLEHVAVQYSRLALNYNRYFDSRDSASMARKGHAFCMEAESCSLRTLTMVALACATCGLWKRAFDCVKLVHSQFLSSWREQSGHDSQTKAGAIRRMHRQLLRVSAKQGNVTASLRLTARIQSIQRRLATSNPCSGNDRPSRLPSSPFPVTDLFEDLSTTVIEDNEETQETSVYLGGDDLRMKAEDWVQVVCAASKSGNWRACFTTIQFLRRYVEAVSYRLDLDLEERRLRQSRYDQLCPALTKTVVCLERSSQYAWATRAVNDWMGWSGRRPRPEAIHAVVRTLVKDGHCTEVVSLVHRCFSMPKDSVTIRKDTDYTEDVLLMAVNELNRKGFYETSDLLVEDAVEKGIISVSLEDHSTHLRLDLREMSLSTVQSIVRLVVRQQGQSRTDHKQGLRDILLTVHGRRCNSSSTRSLSATKVQKVLKSTFSPPIHSHVVDKKVGSLLLPSSEIASWYAHQTELRVLTVASMLRSLSPVNKIKLSVRKGTVEDTS